MHILAQDPMFSLWPFLVGLAFPAIGFLVGLVGYGWRFLLARGLWLAIYYGLVVLTWHLAWSSAGACNLFAIILILGLSGPVFTTVMLRHPMVFVRKVRPGKCAGCGYDLTGNISGRCPECGKWVGHPTSTGSGLPGTSEKEDTRR